jgi:CspA family cold shock protein
LTGKYACDTLRESKRLGNEGRGFSTEKTNNKMQGIIKTLTDRGFGFISRDGETKDLFFHSKDLNGVTFEELKVGDKLTFEVSEGQKGPAAVNVSRA